MRVKARQRVRSRQVVGIIIVLVNEMLREFDDGWMTCFFAVVRECFLFLCFVWYALFFKENRRSHESLGHSIDGCCAAGGTISFSADGPAGCETRAGDAGSGRVVDG